MDMHDPEDRCYYCATDAELSRALHGPSSRTIHMDTPESACPQRADWDPGDQTAISR